MTANFISFTAKLAAASLAVCGLSACAIEQAPTLTQRPAMPIAITTVDLAQDEDLVGLRSAFARSLSLALAAEKVAPSADSDWIADFAVSSHPAEVSITPIGDGAEGQGPDASHGVKSKWYHKCKPERVRASLAVFERQANRLVAKSEGHFIACPGDRARLNDLATLLVSSVKDKTAAGQVQE
ncbi:hypothetical protein FGU71_08785 [Erythrobacter insulae]|uniref:Uncharacterized protein n=1 Tax=Erythrobacter insulae TaxID=2584124 RepID=A0A547PCT8_9SPHN|nr:hypothetical protein [Erythrobacter insulae]TRD11940.1 hypothetical protein FGU71_08785 [Erythrobacter insulae]